MEKNPSRYAKWARDLTRKSGVYVIAKEKWLSSGPGKVVYVGRSSSNKLYATMTRHFQSWEGPQEHTVFDRESVWVKVRVMPKSQPLKIDACEARMIRLHEPEGNTAGLPDTSFNFGANVREEENPF